MLGGSSFRRFFAARTISQWGDTFNAVAIVILVFQLTGSGLKVGAAVGFEIAPVLIFGFAAGAIVDRYPRTRVMISADLGRAVVAALLAAFHTHLWAIYAAAFGLSAFGVFFTPAAASVLPDLVADDDLVGANAAVWSAAVVSQVALAPAAGALVAIAGAGPAFTVNTASFVVSAALLAGLPVHAGARPIRQRWLSPLGDGFKAIRTSRFLSTLAAVQALAALSAGATSALLVVLAERHLHTGAARFGLLIGAIGVGAGLGPLVLQRLVRDVRRTGWLFGPYLLRGLVDLALATTTSLAAALGALGVYGVGTSTGNVTYHTILQSGMPHHIRGRVFAFYDVVWQTARLASIVVGGVLADTYGITVVYYLGGGLLLAAGLVGITPSGQPPTADQSAVPKQTTLSRQFVARFAREFGHRPKHRSG